MPWAGEPRFHRRDPTFEILLLTLNLHTMDMGPVYSVSPPLLPFSAWLPLRRTSLQLVLHVVLSDSRSIICLHVDVGGGEHSFSPLCHLTRSPVR